MDDSQNVQQPHDGEMSPPAAVVAAAAGGVALPTADNGVSLSAASPTTVPEKLISTNNAVNSSNEEYFEDGLSGGMDFSSPGNGTGGNSGPIATGDGGGGGGAAGAGNNEFSTNRGGFRGRPWGPGGAPPRLRGRGGGPPGSPMRGRGGGPPGGGQPPFFRGGGGGGGNAGGGGRGGRFGGPNFDPNWGPPPGMNHYGGPPPSLMGGNSSASNNSNQPGGGGSFGGGGGGGNAGSQQELWVETKTEEGKSYYYHALSRETTWTRPEGPHIKIMSQTDVESLTAKNQHQQQQHNQQQQQQQQSGDKSDDPMTGIGNQSDAKNNKIDSLNGKSDTLENGQNESDNKSDGKDETKSDSTVSISQQIPPLQKPPPQLNQMPQQQQQQQQQHHQQQAMHQHHQQMQQHYGGPPPQFGGGGGGGGGPQYGMPPPGYGGYPQANPWGMPWQQQQQQQQQQHQMMEQPAKSLIVKPGVIEPQVIARAAEWSEHRAPDGRPYYYHAGRGESVWEKPQAIRDLEAARMAAHAGTSPQPPVQLPAGPVMTAMQINATPVMTPQMQQIHQMQAAAAAAAAVAAAGQQSLGGAGGMFDPMGYASMKQQQDMVAAKMNVAEESVEAKLEKKRKQEAEKKKKEEEEKAKLAAARQVDKSRPISSTPIAGTPWCVVWTGDGRVFFYNPSSRTSVWERPEDLLGRPDVDKAISTTPEQLLATMPAKDDKTKGDQVIDSSAAAAAVATLTPTATGALSTAAAPGTVGGPGNITSPTAISAINRRKNDSESSGDDDESTPSKKQKLDGIAVSKQLDNKKMDIGKEAAIEAEVRAARERALVPLEDRVKSFKEMLKEKDVSAFSTWEKELHKIVFDQRYLMLTSRERKQVFEKYVKERAEEERREKRNKMRQKRDDFRALMEHSNLHGKSSFSDFAQKYGKEDRFRGIEKMRERESLFNEFIVEVRRREKEEKQQKKEQIRKDFIALLREHSDIDRHSRWMDVKKRVDSDSRYRAVDNSLLREDYFHEYCKILKDEKKKAKEKERERKEKKEREKREREKEKHRRGSSGGGGGGGSGGGDKDRSNKERDGKEKNKDKGKDKRRNSNDSDKSTKSGDGGAGGGERNAGGGGGGSGNGDDKHHDKIHNDDHEDGEHPLTSEDEAERNERDRERQLRAEQSIKEREKEVQLQLAGHLRDRDKEREHHKRDEAMRHFSALLADLVRNADLTWKEVKKQLRKDHRWESVELLEREDRERLFNDHIDQLTKKKRDKFREMLDELQSITLITAFKDVKKAIRDDPRYLKYNSSEKCEREFKDYIKDKTIEAKASFRELLQECKLITHKSFDTVNENPAHLKEIEEILKNDKRYLVLDHLNFDRSQMLTTYLEDLHKRGPPPPPTASESTRRK